VKEILPGLFHWTAQHEKIGIAVHSYYLKDARVAIDPMLPAEGLAWFREKGAPKHALLTNRHHYRHSGQLVETFGCVVRAHRAGLHEFTKGERVEPFEHGDELPGGIRALEVGVLTPEETALHLPAPRPGARGGTPGGGVLALGDALVRGPDGELALVPDDYMGDDPESVKRGLVGAFRKLLDQRFEHLLLAHGDPLVGEGRERLEAFVESRGG
jgi:hypothetical protein